MERLRESWRGNVSVGCSARYSLARRYTGGVQVPPEFAAYRNLIMARVRNAWNWFDTRNSTVPKVRLQIGPDGNVDLQRMIVTHSSGNKEFDESILRAIRKANPFPPPPAEARKPYRSCTPG